MSIIVSEITKIFREQKALDNVSFAVETGEVLGFLGPNGAGKSTLMKILTGYLTADSGMITINDIDIEEEPMLIKKKIGYLPENNPLYIEMYVKEYLEYVSGFYKLGRRTNERVKEIIKRTGLELEQHKKIGQLSKGYRQRVGLAQAMIHDPDVLILDEPTSGLDPNQIVEIRNLITEAGKEKTIIMSTHIMQEVEAVCDRIIIIDKGRIKADEKKKDIYGSINENNNTVLVEFDKNVAEERLKEIKGLGKLKCLSGNCYLLESIGPDDIRPVIFRFAVDNGFTVLSMQEQEQNLEEVFRRLTSD